jgi:hypothetical protein
LVLLVGRDVCGSKGLRPGVSPTHGLQAHQSNYRTTVCVKHLQGFVQLLAAEGSVAKDVRNAKPRGKNGLMVIRQVLFDAVDVTPAPADLKDIARHDQGTGVCASRLRLLCDTASLYLLSTFSTFLRLGPEPLHGSLERARALAGLLGLVPGFVFPAEQEEQQRSRFKHLMARRQSASPFSSGIVSMS